MNGFWGFVLLIVNFAVAFIKLISWQSQLNDADLRQIIFLVSCLTLVSFPLGPLRNSYLGSTLNEKRIVIKVSVGLMISMAFVAIFIWLIGNIGLISKSTALVIAFIICFSITIGLDSAPRIALLDKKMQSYRFSQISVLAQLISAFLTYALGQLGYSNFVGYFCAHFLNQLISYLLLLSLTFKGHLDGIVLPDSARGAFRNSLVIQGGITGLREVLIIVVSHTAPEDLLVAYVFVLKCLPVLNVYSTSNLQFRMLHSHLDVTSFKERLRVKPLESSVWFLTFGLGLVFININYFHVAILPSFFAASCAVLIAEWNRVALFALSAQAQSQPTEKVAFYGTIPVIATLVLIFFEEALGFFAGLMFLDFTIVMALFLERFYAKTKV